MKTMLLKAMSVCSDLSANLTSVERQVRRVERGDDSVRPMSIMDIGRTLAWN